MTFSPLLSAGDLAAIIDKPATLVFDCRHDLFDPEAGERAHREGHLPGAFHLHLDRDLSGAIIPGKTGRHPLPDPTAFAEKMSLFGLSTGTRVVAYDDKGGGIAARLWWMLRAIGHDRVQVLDGGLPAWTVAGYSLEEGTVPLPATDYRRKTRAYGVSDWQLPLVDLTDAADHPGTIVDSRTAERYRGEHEPIDPVAGHVPEAINYPWPENLGPDGRMKPPAELRERFAELHGRPGEVVFYCGSGVTACHNLLAYTIAYGRVPTLYPGSWSAYLLTL